MSATIRGAYSLALWLRTNAPALYRALSERTRASGLGRLGCDCGVKLGQDPTDTLPTIDVTGSFAPSPALDTLDPMTLEPITIESTPLPSLPTFDTTPVDGSPGLLTSVANFLTTGGGITAALNLATATVQSQTARSVTGAQIARVSAGYNPAAITYRVNPATGLFAPVLSTPQGTLPITQPLLQRLAPNANTLAVGSFLSQNILWISLGLLGVVVLLARR